MWYTLERTESLSHFRMFVAERLHLQGIRYLGLYLIFQVIAGWRTRSAGDRSKSCAQVGSDVVYRTDRSIYSTYIT